jgi:hypothetical protein
VNKDCSVSIQQLEIVIKEKVAHLEMNWQTWVALVKCKYEIMLNLHVAYKVICCLQR